jgi:hypothetical protein
MALAVDVERNSCNGCSKKPLSEAASSAPGRTQQTQQRSKVARRRAIAGGVAALVVIGVLALLLTNGKEVIQTITGTKRETPQLVFALSKVSATTTTDTKPGKVIDDATRVAADVQSTLTTFFQGAFVDPDVWDGDNYEDLFKEVMDEGAAATALNDIDTLTLGSGAGDIYDFVDPGRNKLVVKVLTDTKDQPSEAIATVMFRAGTEKDDGTFSSIEVTGTFFLRHLDGEWRIFSYDVDKTERAAKRAPGSTPSTSATSEASP